MAGRESDEAGSVSRADLDIFKQDIGNELAQLQIALQRSINDLVSDRRQPDPPTPEGGAAGAAGAGNGRLGPQFGGCCMVQNRE